MAIAPKRYSGLHWEPKGTAGSPRTAPNPAIAALTQTIATVQTLVASLATAQATAAPTIIHQGFSSCSATDPFIEAFTKLTGELYAAPNRALSQKIVSLNVAQPTNMRGPGETSGMYAQECAMDELAFKLGIDPIELRRINEPDKEPITGKPYSCRRLLQCIDTGAAAFG